MAVMLSPEWGPYNHINDARDHLTRFVDRVCSPASGIVWTANGNLYPLRAPRRDRDGFGDVVVFEWNKLPPPAPPQVGFWGRVKGFIRGALEAQGQAAMAQSKAQLAMGSAMAQAMGKVFATHPDDGVGVAFDVVCVALSIALLPTGLGALGVMGLLGGAFLLGTDGKAYAMELQGNEEGAEQFKKRTERYRIVATVMTLPDIAYGGFKVAKELMEIRDLRALDRVTAEAATNMSARTSSALRAERLHQIAERANLRAQLRTEQIAAVFRLEVTAKIAGNGSIGLLVREEIQDDESLMREFFRYLQVHCTAVHA